jgi:ABC-type uncharacterized transport system substrate-binding protein
MNERERQGFRIRRLYSRLVLFLAACWGVPSHGADGVALVLSEAGGAYAEVAVEIRHALRARAQISEVPVQAVEALAESHPRLIAAIGTKACRAAADSRTTIPLLCLLIPRSAYERIAASARGRAVSGLLLDQPVSRQMALIRAIIPDPREVAVLLGPESAPLARAIAHGAAEQGLRVATTKVADADEIPSALQSALNDADVLLAVPDSGVYNSRTVQNILRTAFQSKVPLIAFSPAYVKAGALAAVYTTPAQVGRQGARWISLHLGGRSLPAVQPPGEFEVMVNRNVARALGIAIPEEGEIAERLRKMEPSR